MVQKPLKFLCPLLMALSLTAGCTGGRQPPRATLTQPHWSLEALREHLAFLDGLEPGATEQAARYVAARMRDYRLQPVLEERYVLRHGTGEQPPVAVAGYVPGKHPERSRELVIVCAALSRQALEEEGGPAPAAALLEVARSYSRLARFGLTPERSILFAVWVGAETGGQGLRAYLRLPTWSLEHTRAVVYIGLDPADKEAVLALTRDHGLMLYTVPPQNPTLAGSAADAPGTPGHVSPLFPPTPPDGDSLEAPEPSARRALRMARTAHRLLRAEVITARRLLPTLGDSLRIPVH